MKISCATLVSLLALSSSEGAFRPARVSWNDLVNQQGSAASLWDALTQVGMVSITNMPDSFRQSKQDTIAWTHPCSLESELTKEHVFSDGTRRRTMATHTTPGGILQPTIHATNAAASGVGACDKFNQASEVFRQGVDQVTRAFANQLGMLLTSEDGGAVTLGPLLKTRDGEELETIQEVVDQGEHLEHFHSYQKQDSGSAGTIEWHTDQGLFLVFTPGLMVLQQDNDKSKSMGTSGGFFVELQDGSRVVVELDDSDDLVILLGDGVNQYVNHRITDTTARKLRAVPHALSMPAASVRENHQKNARVWYGRMVLPPSNAIHPKHGTTFGHLRELMIQASTDKVGAEKKDEILSLGCSGSTMLARQLEMSSCEEGTIMCWHRCMSVEEFGVSDAICAKQGLDVKCINPRGQLWDNSHGDWYPGCVNASTVELGTPYPKLEDYPRDNQTCTEAAYKAFVETKAASYEHMVDLTNGGVLLWSIEDNNIKGMLSYNGLFGYIAFGFQGPPGGHPMSEGLIIMATPSDIYSAATGFDFTSNATVQEYIMASGTDNKAFRHWMSPLSSTARAATVSTPDTYSVEEMDCFTAMTFSTPGIFNRVFKIDGADQMIWAANGEDGFAGYHGVARGKMLVEWATGNVTFGDETEEEGGTPPGNTTAEPKGDETSASTIASPIWFMSIILPTLYLVFGVN